MKAIYDFPYPILKNDSTSSYRPDYIFEISDINEVVFENNSFTINLRIILQSNTIKNYLLENKCDIYIGYTTDTARRMIKVNNENDIFSLKVPINLLKSIDTISIYAYIIAEDDFLMQYTNEIDPVYDVGQPIFITKKDILAMSNTIEFFYNRTGETIIQFTTIKEEGFKDFKIDLSGDNYISVQISSAINENYQKIKGAKITNCMNILNASFVLLALIHTLSMMAITGFDEHLDKRWFKVLVQVFSAQNIDIKNELKDMSDNLDISKIYDFAQKFMNNYFEQSIVLAGKEIL